METSEQHAHRTTVQVLTILFSGHYCVTQCQKAEELVTMWLTMQYVINNSLIVPHKRILRVCIEREVCLLSKLHNTKCSSRYMSLTRLNNWLLYIAKQQEHSWV